MPNAGWRCHQCHFWNDAPGEHCRVCGAFRCVAVTEDPPLNEHADLETEVIALTDYLRSRGLDQRHACSVMGQTIACLIKSDVTFKSFVKVFQEVYRATKAGEKPGRRLQ